MHIMNHIGPDHYLNLETAIAVTMEEVKAAWKRAYAELQAALRELSPNGRLFIVFPCLALNSHIVAQLSNTGLNVLQTKSLSCGDAWLALGQARVAARDFVSAPRIDNTYVSAYH